jgi:hypothetical protein
MKDATKLYALADTLGTQLIAKDGRISPVGKLTWKTPWGTKLQVGDKFLGKMGEDGKAHALLRVLGDLWLYVTVDHDLSVMLVLDGAKTGITLPRTHIMNWTQALLTYKEGVKGLYFRKGRGSWTKRERPSNL